MKTSNQLKQQLGFNVPRFSCLVVSKSCSCLTALPQTVRVGGGSNCFPLVGTRDPPSTHPASSGGVKQLPNVCNVFISVFAIFSLSSRSSDQKFAEVQCV